jgi:hypothetical protein
MWRQLIDPKSSQSSARVAFLFTVALSNVVVWFAWIISSIWSHQLVDIPEGVVYIYAAANGISFAGKASQSFAERRKDDSSRSQIKAPNRTEEYCD